MGMKGTRIEWKQYTLIDIKYTRKMPQQGEQRAGRERMEGEGCTCSWGKECHTKVCSGTPQWTHKEGAKPNQSNRPQNPQHLHEQRTRACSLSAGTNFTQACGSLVTLTTARKRSMLWCRVICHIHDDRLVNSKLTCGEKGRASLG